MTNQGDQVLREQLLGLTGTPEWKALTNEIEKEIYHNQASLLENAQNWDQVVYLKGWNACLAYIINTRDRIIVEIENEKVMGDANADL